MTKEELDRALQDIAERKVAKVIDGYQANGEISALANRSTWSFSLLKSNFKRRCEEIFNRRRREEKPEERRAEYASPAGDASEGAGSEIKWLKEAAE